MRKNIRLLEDRVQRAAQRLRQLSDERGQLHDEVRTLRSRLEVLETRAAAAPAKRVPGGLPEGEVVSALRQALAELRGS